MSARLPYRLSILLFAALAWAAVPSVLFAGPGAGHGGGGGSHGGGGGHSGGGGGHASAASGHISSPASGNYRATSNAPSNGNSFHAQPGSYAASGAGSAQGALSSFAPSSESGAPRSAATEAMLSRMAARGWSFTPSAGVTRAVAAQRLPVGSLNAARVIRIPAILPVRGPFGRNRAPYATSIIIPRGGFGFGGPCLFNGFTSVCGPNSGYFGSSGVYPYPCSPRFGYVNCGLGFGYGYGIGAGYGYGYDPGYGAGSLDSLPADDSAPPDGSGSMDQEEGYIAEPGGTVPPDVDAEEPNPDELGPVATSKAPAQIILKDGSAFAVKSYWVSHGELYYQPVTGGLNHLPVDQLDLAATVAANSRNGVPFTLSDRPPHD
jgi:hypothetical protein